MVLCSKALDDTVHGDMTLGGRVQHIGGRGLGHDGDRDLGLQGPWQGRDQRPGEEQKC